jgi:tyrosine-protein kinase Etk/Wzc
MDLLAQTSNMTKPRDGTQPSNTLVYNHDEIQLLDLLIILAKSKGLIVAVTLAGALMSLVVAIGKPNVYTANAKILPPQPNQSAAASMLGQLGQLGQLSASSLGIKNPNELYLGMLKSRTVADKLIDRFNLSALYRTESMVVTRNALKEHSSLTLSRDGLITVEFDDIDPKRAADIANAYVEELEKLTQTLAVSEAAQRRLFFERQLQRTKDELAKAQVAARSALESGGVTMVDEQGKSMIESIGRLRAQITAKEVQISASKGFATDQNPEIVRARQELSALQQQLQKLEGTNIPHGLSATTKRGGEGLKNLALLRDVKFNEVLFELLAKQYELAKIDEAKDAGIVQVLDYAVPPDKKSKPQRAQMVLVGSFSSLLVALLLVWLRELRERFKHDPAQTQRLRALGHYASLRAPKAGIQE